MSSGITSVALILTSPPVFFIVVLILIGWLTKCSGSIIVRFTWRVPLLCLKLVFAYTRKSTRIMPVTTGSRFTNKYPSKNKKNDKKSMVFVYIVNCMGGIAVSIFL